MSKTGLEDYMMEQLEKAAWRGRMEREVVEEGGAITIPGAPVAKGRPRVYNGRGVTPERTRRWEAAAAAIIRASGVRVVGAVELELVAVMERPQRLYRRADPAGRIPAPVRPDIDNVVKAALDALVLGGALVDDGAVVKLVASKVYAGKGEGPRVEMVLREVKLTDWTTIPLT